MKNGLSGIEVHALGAINIGGAAAMGNGTAGDADAGYGIYLDNATGATLVRNILLRTSSTFSGNYSDGLHALSLGSVQTNGLVANQNGGDGIRISNLGAAASTQGVSLLGTNVLVGNDGVGLGVVSRGNLSTGNISANTNLGGGADLNNSASSFAATVTISGVNQFNANGDPGNATGAGLVVRSRGRISLTNATANSNADHGVDLRNSAAGLNAPAITITGTSSFSKNASTGLAIFGGGVVSVSNFAADLNTGDGVQIFAQGTVALSCGSINKNAGTGLVVQSFGGNLALNGVFAYRNLINTNLAAAVIVNGMTCK